MHTSPLHKPLLAVLMALLGGCASTTTLRPFTTDGCSLFPDRSLATGRDWCSCCVTHDWAYWRGGSADERLKADHALQACVLAKTDDEALATLMYRGVRLGGSPYLPSSFRWGYGWGYGRFYSELAADEQASADRLQLEHKAAGSPGCPCAKSIQTREPARQGADIPGKAL
jgi:hypothetical protein